MELTEKKKILFSGIQPTGVPTLGNYLGAIKNWNELQDDYNSIFCVVDMHAITVRQVPATLRAQTISMYALLLACGIDPKRSVPFIQSHVPQHAELSWILSCYTQFGELSRMTQFKDKSAKHANDINAGLFTYPTLMAADILLYQAELVPIGADQKQHLELARDIANRFNTVNGNTFVMPDGYFSKQSARVMSLSDPMKKMSKSDENANGYISILDDPATIVKKFKRAVTDSDAQVCFGDGKEGINNLMSIYSVMTGANNAAIEREFDSKGYGYFKEQVGNCAAEHLRPIRERYAELLADKAYLEESYTVGAQKAAVLAERTIAKVKKKVGFIAR